MQADLLAKRDALGYKPGPSKVKLSPFWTQAVPEKTPEQVEREMQEHARWVAKQNREQFLNRWRELVADRGSRYHSASFESYEAASPEQQAAVAKARTYATEINDRVKRGQNLIFVGPRGTGKDHLAMAVARYALEANIQVEWHSGMDIFRDFRDAMRDKEKGESEYRTEKKLIRDLRSPTVLWISDPMPPTGALTEWQQGVLYSIVDERYNHRRATWITINAANAGEAAASLGAATQDRLRHDACVIECKWASYRRASE
jgi:DNA replication protein DnaC